MFREPTINDFLDNLRWHLAKAMTRSRGSIAHVMSDHASRGILQSSMTYQRVFGEVQKEFEAGIETAFGELKRAVRKTKLDRNDLRQMTVQTLENFALEAKALIGAHRYRGLVGATIDENLRSLDQHLAFMIRQFDVGFFEPEEPEIPQVSNAITIGAMTGSTIQQGSPGASQTVQFTLNIGPARAALTAFEAAADGANLPPKTRDEITADVQTIKAQLSKSSPSVAIVQEAGGSLRSIVEGIAAGVLTPPVIATASALWSALGLG